MSGRYPANFWKAMGQMWLAEIHVWEKWPELAKEIESERLKAETEDNYWPDLEKLIIIATEYAKQQVEATTILSPKDTQVFLDMLEEDAGPNKALKEAAQKHKKQKEK
jgi:hypothetical protein